MSRTSEIRRRIVAVTVLGLMVLPALAAAVPVSPESSGDSPESNWWENTNMDHDGDFIHDAIWKAANSDHYDYVDENGRISVIVDFDHTPTADDQEMLEESVGFETQFRYWLIDSIAGTVSFDLIHELVQLRGVVFVELDGRLEVQMNDVN